MPDRPGLTAPRWSRPPGGGDLDVLWMSGGNFLDVLPDPPAVEAALARVPLRVHQDVVLTSQMLVEGDDVVLLPVATRYEQEGGGTETTTERRIVFSPEMPRRVGEARSEWRLFADVVTPGAARSCGRRSRGRPTPTCGPRSPGWCRCTPASRRWPTPATQVQWGGRHLCAGGEFPTPTAGARFSALDPPEPTCPTGRSWCRRGGASSSTRWSRPRSTRSPAPGATP